MTPPPGVGLTPSVLPARVSLDDLVNLLDERMAVLVEGRCGRIDAREEAVEVAQDRHVDGRPSARLTRSAIPLASMIASFPSGRVSASRTGLLPDRARSQARRVATSSPR